MSDAYDANLRKLAHGIAEELGFQSFIREGVYTMISGPSFETPAELRFLQAGGADAVGKITCHKYTSFFFQIPKKYTLIGIQYTGAIFGKLSKEVRKGNALFFRPFCKLKQPF